MAATRRLILAVGLLVGSMVAPASVQAAGGCGINFVNTIKQVVALRPTIVVARVISSRFDGAAYDLSVETVVAGSAHVGHWSFGPKKDPRPFHECAPNLIPDGTRVILFIWRPGTDPNPYNWWPIPADEVMPVLFVDQTASTLSGLVDELRAALPATSTEPGPVRQLAPGALAAWALGIIAFAVLMVRPGWLRPQRAVRPSSPMGR